MPKYYKNKVCGILRFALLNVCMHMLVIRN